MAQKFREQRFGLLASYPDCPYNKEEPISVKGATIDYSRWPHLFKRLEWFEMRSFEDLMSVTHIRVVSPKYYKEGDYIQVIRCVIDTKSAKPRFIGYEASRYPEQGHGHQFALNECYPATKEEYDSNPLD